MAKLSQQDYEERKSRQSDGTASDEDLRLVKHYEREGYECRGSNSETSSAPESKTTETVNDGHPSSARTTGSPSKRARTDSSTVRPTGGPGKAE